MITSTIAHMRIGTCKQGEDNPVGRFQPWFTNALWIDFSKQVMTAYAQNFQ
jgi:hypothetical protein